MKIITVELIEWRKNRWGRQLYLYKIWLACGCTIRKDAREVTDEERDSPNGVNSWLQDPRFHAPPKSCRCPVGHRKTWIEQQAEKRAQLNVPNEKQGRLL